MRSTWWKDESELDDQQKDVIRIGIDEGPVLITGQPGSGKTNLALLRANYLVYSGLPRTVVLTMGRVISNFIYAGAKNIGLQPHNVTTFHSWAQHLIRNAGGEVPDDTEDYEADLATLVSILRDLADDDKLEHYDSIILDEAQDYPKGAARIFTHLTNRLFITGDEQQRINDKTENTMREFRKIAKITIELERHYRNGLAICKLVGALRGGDYVSKSGYDEEENPSRFERHKFKDLKEQVYFALDMIPNQLDAYPDDLVGIIAPTNALLLEVMKYIDGSGSEVREKVQLQHVKKGYAHLDPEKRVIALNFHNSKGLEFRSAHLMGVDDITRWPDKPKTRNVVFTALTRAKTSLDLYHVGTLPYWLESAIKNVTESPKPPSKLSVLFGKGS